MTTQTWPLHAVADPSVSLPARSIASLGTRVNAAEESGMYACVGNRRYRWLKRRLSTMLPVLLSTGAIGCAAATIVLAAS